MVRISAAALRRLTAAGVSKYAETDVGVVIEFFPPVAISPPQASGSGKQDPEEPSEPTPDEWLRKQYEKPDGT